MSVENFDPNSPPITITPAACQHFEKSLAADAERQILRISTRESGCTGYAYVLDMVVGAEAEDKVFAASDKLTLAVDQQALPLLLGMEIDYVAEGVNKVVKFNNPNVVAECGCGESFSVSS